MEEEEEEEKEGRGHGGRGGRCRVKGPAKETHPDPETRAKGKEWPVKETHFGPEIRDKKTHSAPDKLCTKTSQSLSRKTNP